MSLRAASTSMGAPRSSPPSSAYARCRFPTTRSASSRSVYRPRSVSRAGLERRDAGGAAPDRKVLHEAEVAQDVVDEPGAGHWAVTGHDHLRAQWLDDSLEDLDGSLDGAHHEKRCAAVEQQISAEEQGTLRDPDDRVVRGVRRHADVQDLAAQVVGPDGHVRLEGQERRCAARHPTRRRSRCRGWPAGLQPAARCGSSRAPRWWRRAGGSCRRCGHRGGAC